MKDFNVDHIPAPIRIFIEQSWKRGFRLCLVGGYVRDWLLGKESNDFDFEIRHVDDYKDDDWIEFLRQSFPNSEYIGVGVFRIKLDNIEIELSSPRAETFNDEVGHKNFTPHFDSTLSYEESFKRRDLRINAIGFEFLISDGQLVTSLIDPFDGTKDIEVGVVSHINNDFFRDPVRLLRAIRFSINTGFKLKTSKDYSNFDLSRISEHYLNYESRKCKDPVSFLEQLIDIINHYNICLPVKLSELKTFKASYLLSKVNTLEEALLFSTSIIDVDVFKFFAIKKNKYQRAIPLKSSYMKMLEDECLDTKFNFLFELSRQDDDQRLVYYSTYKKLVSELKGARSKDAKNKVINEFAQSFTA